MSTLVVILTAAMAVPGNGPEKVSGEVDNAFARMESSVWARFGLKLREADKKQVQQAASLLKGGLKVIAVKKGSPADRAGVRTGDILVGLHEWEILSLQHVAWVLARDGFQNLLPMRFYIVRDNRLCAGRIESD